MLQSTMPIQAAIVGQLSKESWVKIWYSLHMQWIQIMYGLFLCQLDRRPWWWKIYIRILYVSLWWWSSQLEEQKSDVCGIIHSDCRSRVHGTGQCCTGSNLDARSSWLTTWRMDQPSRQWFWKTISISKNPQFLGQTKHIEIKYHFIWEQVKVLSYWGNGSRYADERTYWRQIIIKLAGVRIKAASKWEEVLEITLWYCVHFLL